MNRATPQYLPTAAMGRLNAGYTTKTRYLRPGAPSPLLKAARAKILYRGGLWFRRHLDSAGLAGVPLSQMGVGDLRAILTAPDAVQDLAAEPAE